MDKTYDKMCDLVNRAIKCREKYNEIKGDTDPELPDIILSVEIINNRCAVKCIDSVKGTTIVYKNDIWQFENTVKLFEQELAKIIRFRTGQSEIENLPELTKIVFGHHHDIEKIHNSAIMKTKRVGLSKLERAVLGILSDEDQIYEVAIEKINNAGLTKVELAVLGILTEEELIEESAMKKIKKANLTVLEQGVLGVHADMDEIIEAAMSNLSEDGIEYLRNVGIIK